jgi:protease II
VKKVQPVLGGFDSSRYATERLWATAPDGTRVPISLVYHTDLARLDGTDPLLLDAYGRQAFAALVPGQSSIWQQVAAPGGVVLVAVGVVLAMVPCFCWHHHQLGTALPVLPCSYEARNDPDFRPSRLSLIDRGFTFAIAHVRGGGG